MRVMSVVCLVYVSLCGYPLYAALDSPQATLSQFVTQMEEVQQGHEAALASALATMDFSQHQDQSPAFQRTQASALLRILVLTRALDLSTVPTRERGQGYRFHTYPQGDIEITYHPDKNQWLFAASSLNNLPEILPALLQYVVATPERALATFSSAASALVSGSPHRLQDALLVLDLSYLRADKQQDKAADLVRLLYTLMQQDGKTFTRPEITDEPRVTLKRYPQGDVALVLNARGQWQFARATLDAIPLILTQRNKPQTMDISFRSALAQNTVKPAGVSLNLVSPRATMGTFLRGMNDVLNRGQSGQIATVLSTLDLSEVSTLVRREIGWNLAQKLYAIMNRTRLVVLSEIPDGAHAVPYRFHAYAQGALHITQTADGRWLFSKESLALVPAILDGLADYKKIAGSDDPTLDLPFDVRLRAVLPGFFKYTVLSLEVWQWTGLLLTILFGLVADKISCYYLMCHVNRWKRKKPIAYQHVSGDVLRPLALMVMAGIWWTGLSVLALPQETLIVLLLSAKFLASLSGVWSAYRLIDILGAFLLAKALRTESRLDDALAPLTTKVIKIFITVIGIAFLADTLSVDITSLLAGLGLGGLAFALAAKDVASNLFGSITILWDRPFHVGDWVKIGEVEGTVEVIGFRSTRIRTFYHSLVTVPNAGLITASVDNMGSRQYRRHKFMLSLTYETQPAQIETFCEGIRELILLHPYMRKDYYHVYFTHFGAASLDILVYVFWTTPDWGTELREKERLLLDILRLADRVGVEFAYPTQTVFLKRSEAGLHPSEAVCPAAQDQSAAQILGQQLAKDIVESTTGVGVKPAPVAFNKT